MSGWPKRRWYVVATDDIWQWPVLVGQVDEVAAFIGVKPYALASKISHRQYHSRGGYYVFRIYEDDEEEAFQKFEREYLQD